MKKNVILESVIGRVGQINDHGDILTKDDLQKALETYKGKIDSPSVLVIEKDELKLVVYDEGSKDEDTNNSSGKL